MSVEVVTAEELAKLTERVADLERRLAADARPEPSPYMTIPEVATFLRCSRGRVDDLLSQSRLPRTKDGARTLVARAAVLAYLNTTNGGTGRAAPYAGGGQA